MTRSHVRLAALTLLLATATGAVAQVRINVGINPFGFGGYPPPVVYPPPVYYPPPGVVYMGDGRWGGRDSHRDQHRGRSPHGRHR